MAKSKANRTSFRKDQKKSDHKRSGGRPTTSFKDRVNAIIDQYDLVAFLGRVAAGIELDQAMTAMGRPVQVPPKLAIRIQATELLLDRALGKPKMEMEHSGQVAQEVIVTINGMPDGSARG